jgi:hypothetical protein
VRLGDLDEPEHLGPAVLGKLRCFHLAQPTGPPR